LFTQTPAEQYSLGAQSASTSHGPVHVFPLHTPGAHGCCCATGQTPVPVHAAASVAMSFVQLADRHSTPAAG